VRIAITLAALVVLCSPANGQKIISTKELADITTKYGADSTLTLLPFFTQSLEVDTAVAVDIALKCSDYWIKVSQLSFFSSVGQSLKHKDIAVKALDDVRSYRQMVTKNLKAEDARWSIPDELFHVIIFQNKPDGDSAVESLEAEFNFWERCADSIKSKYPTAFKRFFQRFNGMPPSEQFYNDCKLNSYKLAWTLNKLGSDKFRVEQVNAIRAQLLGYLKDYDMHNLHIDS
jgi:hypothetical protein